VPSIDYIDLNASWYATEKAEISVGVINVTDQEPPLYTNPAQMNTDPSTYDVLGRRYFMRAAYKF
jgi:iron complex outermembrane recepter protein